MVLLKFSYNFKLLVMVGRHKITLVRADDFAKTFIRMFTKLYCNRPFAEKKTNEILGVVVSKLNRLFRGIQSHFILKVVCTVS